MLKFLLIFLGFAMSVFADSEKHILVLNSYDMSYVWASSVQEGIMEGLKDLPAEFEVHYEFMDSRRYHGEDYFIKLSNWFQEKYQNLKFDLVLTSDDDAFNFYLKNHKKNFQDSHLFFCGKGTFNQEILKEFPGRVHGVMEYFDMLSNLKLGGKLHRTKKAYYIVDASTTGIIQHEKWMREFKEKAPDFEVTSLSLTQYSHQELLAKVAELKEGIILLNVVGQDKNGAIVDNLSMTRKIVEASHIPIYVESSMRLGTGVVGGKVIDGHMHGKMVAQNLVHFIRGDVQNLELIQNDRNLYMFDYKALERFNVNLSILPIGSIVIGKPQGLYVQYKKWLWGLSLFLGILIFVIFMQNYQISSKKKLELHLQELVVQRTKELSYQMEEQKKLRKTLISREKLASLGNLTAGIAHEIKNPLNIILNSAVAMENRIKKIPTMDEKSISDIGRLIQFIIKNSYRADSIIQNMLGQVSHAKNDVTQIQVNKLLDEAIGLVYHASRSKYDLNVDLDRDYKSVSSMFVSKENLLRVFINIIDNSFYALHLKFIDDPNFRPHILFRTYDAPQTVIIEIRDNGTGIPVEILEKVQQPFFTTKPAGEGTGLGLSMVNDIISSIGGELEITTELGSFTMVKLILPSKMDVV